MTDHLIEIHSDDITAFWASSEYATILNYLKEENKTLCLFYENGLKIVDDEEIFIIEKLNYLRDNVTIVIDRNLLISARDIFQTGQISEKRHKFFCALMYYGMSIDCMVDPTMSIYEGGNRYKHKAIDDLTMFRIINNLKPQVLLDLLLGEIEKIPEQDWNEAKQKTKQIKDYVKKENFDKELTLYKYSYPYMLKTVQIIRKQGIDFPSKVKDLLNWSISEFIMKEEALMISMYCFKVNGGILKKHGSDNFSELITNIKNAAWDVSLISYLKYQSKKNEGRYYILVSEDNHLIKAARYFLDSKMDFKEIFGKSEKEILKLINNANEIQNEKNRSEIVKDRLNKIDIIINGLENELKKTVSLKKTH